MAATPSIPSRSERKAEDCWDLSKLYPDDAAWDRDLPRLAAYRDRFLAFKGTLAQGLGQIKKFLELGVEAGMLDERLGYYAFLRLSEDAGDDSRQKRQSSYDSVAVELQAAQSWFSPELLSLPEADLAGMLKSPELADFRIGLEKIIRNKPHVRSASEEEILALQEDAFQTPQKVFNSLVDVDFVFGTVETPEGPVPLSHGSFQVLLQHKDRSVRKLAFETYYALFDQHKNTLGNLYIGSIKQDVFRSKVRKFPGAVEKSLFPDNVPLSVYENLIAQVREGLPSLHKYYALRAKHAGLETLELFDTKTSLVEGVEHQMEYPEACKLVLESLAPLGPEYVKTLEQGLTKGWVDRYENKGKDSGAYSAGSFVGDPYILLNFKPSLVRDVFTLAHEAGHSMHSWYSARNNPFQSYNYTIFEAEIASTFNEQLLFNHWFKKLGTSMEGLYLVNKQIDDLLATLFRQTMFAEFELRCHRLQEAGEPLSVDILRSEYRKLQEAYFGPHVKIHELADLEGLRIPHFYRAFYVYKYATGISAAIALANRVLAGEPGSVEAYFTFLKSGGSRYPLESVQAAGVDMSRPEPIRSAIGTFAALVETLEKGLAKS